MRHGDRANPFLSCADVGVAVGEPAYECRAPYSPGRPYPEYFDAESAGKDGPNHAYEGVRESFRLLNLDGEKFGTDQWNPLGDILQPGDTVVLKPNFVREFRETQPGHGDCLITHGAVIRAVLDYVWLALRGDGRVVIADAPHSDADFEAIRRIAGLDEIQEFYHKAVGFDVEVYDLRPERTDKIDGVIVGHERLAGDPAGYVRVNLGKRSAFAEINDLCHMLYGSEYDTRELYSHQHDDVHEYLISKTVLDADCVISLPKMKTHKKAGITVNMKNLVGINGNKNWLPHHREGTPSQGGDQFAEDGFKRRMERATVAGFKRVFPSLGPLRPVLAGPIKAVGKRLFGDTNAGTIRSGNWYGNDTVWRMVIDLNRILMYSDAKGVLHDQPVRRFFSVVDGIVAGEGNGPLDATPKKAGVVLAGFNPVAVDRVAARLMGFDCRRLPVLERSQRLSDWPLVSFGADEITLRSEHPDLSSRLKDADGWSLSFAPHFGWRGHVELRFSGGSAKEGALCAG